MQTTQELIEQIARELGHQPSVVWKWRERGSVPHRWRMRIAEYAARVGVVLDDRHFESLQRTRVNKKRTAA